jgi:hypothetical protein
MASFLLITRIRAYEQSRQSSAFAIKGSFRNEKFSSFQQKQNLLKINKSFAGRVRCRLIASPAAAIEDATAIHRGAPFLLCSCMARRILRSSVRGKLLPIVSKLAKTPA